MKDWLLLWYDTIAAEGFAALGHPFSNYTPPYLYLLALATTTHALVPKVAAIKLISIVFDLLNAVIVYKILRVKYPPGAVPLLGGAGFLLLPTVILNSAVWGQSDSIYTFFVLACLYRLLKNSPLSAVVLFGIALSIKAQSMFLAPLLLLLTIRRRIPWYLFALVPVVYAAMMIPAALAGRPLMQLMTIYIDQADVYSGLSMHAPTLYVFVPEALHDPALVAGVLITIVAVAVWLWIYARRIHDFSPDVLLVSALVSVVLLPFFLPKMHDRYFYLADVLSYLVALYIPRLWYLAVGYQVVSGMAYSIFLIPSVITMKRRLADSILDASAVVNALVMSLVLWSQYAAVVQNAPGAKGGPASSEQSLKPVIQESE